MSGLFRQVPNIAGLEEFCDIVFTHFERKPSYVVRVEEIYHYKEKRGFEHEFLIVKGLHDQGEEYYRIERGAVSSGSRKSFFGKLLQTSSSVFPAHDTVRPSSSLTQLTSGMQRGPSILVSRVPVPRESLFTLRDLCLILSFFPVFSPQYKLGGEQCYWLCHTIMTAVCTVSNGLSVVREIGFDRAGRFGKVSINMATSVAQLFVYAYNLIHMLEHDTIMAGSDTNIALTSEKAQALTRMLWAPSTRAKIRAVKAVTALASQSALDRKMLVIEGSVTQLGQILVTASIELKAFILLALDALMDDLSSFRIQFELGDALEGRQGDVAAVDTEKVNYDRIIGGLITLLQDERLSVCRASASIIVPVIRSFDEYFLQVDARYLLPIYKVYESVLSLLLDEQLKIREELVRLFGTLTNYAASWSSVEKFHPQVLELIQSKHHVVSQSGGRVMQLVISILDKNNSWGVRKLTLHLSRGFTSRPDLYYLAKDIAPQLFELLKDGDLGISLPAFNVVMDMVGKPEFHPVIQNAMPQILSAFHYEVPTRWNINLLHSILQQDQLRLAVKQALQRIPPIPGSIRGEVFELLYKYPEFDKQFLGSLP